MLDLTSSLYLGLRHPSEALPPWPSLTTGRPAALARPAGWVEVCQGFAGLIGAEDALLARSTLHALSDVVAVLARAGWAVLVDAAAYPVSGAAAALAVARGVPVRTFRHHAPDALAAALGARGWRGRRPLVLTDGLCPTCGRTAPLPVYGALAAERGGLVVVDDTQGVGVLGAEPSSCRPYGRGGGGTARLLGGGPRLLVVASLAKGLGAPLAAVGGPRALIGHLAREAPSGMHSSPPSAADLAAAGRALRLNRRVGDRLRARLASLVLRLQVGLRRLGVGGQGPPFPVQTLAGLPGSMATATQRRLADQGVTTVLTSSRCCPEPRLTLVVTATLRPADVDRALSALATSLPDRSGHAA